MANYADILPVVGRSFPLLLTYAVPGEMQAQLAVGSQVAIPLSGRPAVGYVVSLHDQPPPEGETKEIESLLQAPPAFSEKEVALARWMAQYYCCPFTQALRPFIADAGLLKVRRQLLLTPAGEARLQSPENLKSEQLTVLRALETGRTGRKTLAALVGAKRVAAVLRSLKDQGWVTEPTTLVASGGGSRLVEFVSLAIDREAAKALADSLASRAPKQAAVLAFFLAQENSGNNPLCPASEEIPISDLVQAGKPVSAVRALAGKGALRLRRLPSARIPWPDAPTDYPPVPVLNAQQQAASERIVHAIKSGRQEVFLLFGVTGSGKTEIFLRAALEVFRQGKQALVLLPEISLTAQAVGLFRSRFGKTVAVIHSALSLGERKDEKERIRQNEARVIVGPRSALFAPFVDLGLVVVDEEHEASYKQEQEPRYHAREVALKLAEQFHCPCVLASATPSLESYYKARQGTYTLLRLEQRPEGRALPKVHLLDLRGKSRRAGILLPELGQALADGLTAGGQAILFLNRRGHSTYLFCPQCGHSFRCPHCQVALIFHAADGKLHCHHCDNVYTPPTTCPNCQGAVLKFTGYGTQKLAEEVAKIYPTARVSRMDRDTTSTKGSHVRVISDFRAAVSDLLVGTQMLSKGLDFPGVTVVGVVAADISLNTPDFRAGERTFQLLTQVAGRAGRGVDPGVVYVQTYHPNHYAIQAAKDHDYDEFYKEEIRLREEACYPPFCYLANILVSAPEAAPAEKHCEELAEVLRAAIGERPVEILGPAPAPLAKLKDRYRFHFLLRTVEPGLLQDLLGNLQEELSGRGKIHVVVDIDPVSMM
jgi:primosomal protein N' (replication factor Y) (superfamily II helicase)